MLKAALCGNYVNFGVFRLYGDDALDDVLNMFVKLLLSVSQRDLMVRYNAVVNHILFYITQK
jgi:exportin-7